MDEEAQSRVDVWKYAYGFDTMRVVACVIELELPDVLENHGSPMTLSQLSSAVGCPETSLYRILRFLTHNGIFKKQGNSTEDPASVSYAQTPLSRLLTRDNMGPFVLLQAGPPGQRFGMSTKDLKAGKGSGLEAEYSEDIIWKPEVEEAYDKLFQEFLACHARASTKAIIDYCPEAFQGISCLVDVGGHQGTAVGMLVKAFPWIKGINFDRPDVVSEAPPIDGIEHVGGDMFESVPKADAVMLMWILHDWSDSLCIDILKKCKEAVPADTGKVIIVEAVIDEEGGDEYTGARLALDMTVMAVTVMEGEDC
ncbi:Acetylserotonin O-methyltransferase [Sesamum angolense]|uniref:Acetylserotonin O-methyltransferase n=1 Tax=Sesamum angolense TaxID=2727404 RepID=A0AAE1VYX0_9LAMI|nr:Acetylserotonin O-methyltransferase [Sesamum angolense]